MPNKPVPWCLHQLLTRGFCLVGIASLTFVDDEHLMMNNHVEVSMNQTLSSPGFLSSWCFITEMKTLSKTEDAADRQMSMFAVLQ